jgi:carbon-monoxide dehydrogenase catalytic subunit
VVDNEAGMEHLSRGLLPGVDMILIVSDCSRREIQAAAGSAAHSDHGREIAHVLHRAARGSSYQVRDEAKLLSLATEWDIETEGRDIYDVAHEVAEFGLMEYGKAFGTLKFLERATEERQKCWADEEISLRAIDREISTSLHMTNMGNIADAETLVRQSLRVGMADGWGGSMMATAFTGILNQSLYADSYLEI